VIPRTLVYGWTIPPQWSLNPMTVNSLIQALDDAVAGMLPFTRVSVLASLTAPGSFRLSDAMFTWGDSFAVNTWQTIANTTAPARSLVGSFTVAGIGSRLTFRFGATIDPPNVSGIGVITGDTYLNLFIGRLDGTDPQSLVVGPPSSGVALFVSDINQRFVTTFVVQASLAPGDYRWDLKGSIRQGQCGAAGDHYRGTMQLMQESPVYVILEESR